MTNEELILEKLGRIEAELAEVRTVRETWNELVDDFNPLLKSGFQLLLKELGKIESGFQLDDVFLLVKRFLRNMKNLAEALDMLENGLELWDTVEPMAKSMVHNLIFKLGALEQKGVFRTYEAMLDVRAKMAANYGAADIEAMGDTFVHLVGLLKKMANPEFMALLDKLMDLPAAVDLSKAKPVGALGMLSAMSDPKFKEGLGVAMELTKALGGLRG
ncbi:MAG: DUF1641 domain-containing protein [Desulfovibrionaceae bacterium]|nr:DUF1641 domain-containing protein [Desulfovibrionaceae bacterium]MBF0513391.1 DUF1641 domain-containing protein [Desulfovibrionaceae bacterium]